MEHHPSARRGSAVAVLVLLVALLLPAQALAQVNVLGLHRGFSQSAADPRSHPFMELEVRGQDDKGNFSGILFAGTPDGVLPFFFTGKLLDPPGAFKGTGEGEAGQVQFTGLIQMLPGGAALTQARFKFRFPDGTVDQGVTTLLRSFAAPPDPCLCGITGDWTGGGVSDLTRGESQVHLAITEQEGTSFAGTEEVSGIPPYSIVGTIDANGHVLYIGVSDVGRVLVGGLLTDGRLDLRYVRNFATGAVDLGILEVTPTQ